MGLSFGKGYSTTHRGGIHIDDLFFRYPVSFHHGSWATAEVRGQRSEVEQILIILWMESPASLDSWQPCAANAAGLSNTVHKVLRSSTSSINSLT